MIIKNISGINLIHLLATPKIYLNSMKKFKAPTCRLLSRARWDMSVVSLASESQTEGWSGDHLRNLIQTDKKSEKFSCCYYIQWRRRKGVVYMIVSRCWHMSCLQSLSNKEAWCSRLVGQMVRWQANMSLATRFQC